jgi:hypothetical protein
MDSIQSFIRSNMFYGIPIYPLKRDKPWYGFLYISKHIDKNKLKIGYTHYDIKRRSKELIKEDFNTPMYVWASPNPQVLEKYVKQILIYFTKPQGKYADEIFYNIPLETLVDVVRLIILYVVVKENWIADDKYYEALSPFFGGPPFNIIQDNKTTYTAQLVTDSELKNGTRVKVLWEGEWLEATIEGKRIGKLKNSKNESIGPGWKVRFDEGTYYEIPESRIRPIYEKLDNDRVLDLDEAYYACNLERRKLKL